MSGLFFYGFMKSFIALIPNLLMVSSHLNNAKYQ